MNMDAISAGVYHGLVTADNGDSFEVGIARVGTTEAQYLYIDKSELSAHGITDLADVFQLTFEEQAGSLAMRVQLLAKDSNTEKGKSGELSS